MNYILNMQFKSEYYDNFFGGKYKKSFRILTLNSEENMCSSWLTEQYTFLFIFDLVFYCSRHKQIFTIFFPVSVLWKSRVLLNYIRYTSMFIIKFSNERLLYISKCFWIYVYKCKVSKGWIPDIPCAYSWENNGVTTKEVLKQVASSFQINIMYICRHSCRFQ